MSTHCWATSNNSSRHNSNKGEKDSSACTLSIGFHAGHSSKTHNEHKAANCAWPLLTVPLKYLNLSAITAETLMIRAASQHWDQLDVQGGKGGPDNQIEEEKDYWRQDHHNQSWLRRRRFWWRWRLRRRWFRRRLFFRRRILRWRLQIGVTSSRESLYNPVKCSEEQDGPLLCTQLIDVDVQFKSHAVAFACGHTCSAWGIFCEVAEPRYRHQQETVKLYLSNSSTIKRYSTKKGTSWQRTVGMELWTWDHNAGVMEVTQEYIFYFWS